MQLTMETIQKLDRIIENHNAGNSDNPMAQEIGCHVSQIRAFLALARKLGTPIKKFVGAKTNYSPEARAILREAMKAAQAKIAQLGNGAHL